MKKKIDLVRAEIELTGLPSIDYSPFNDLSYTQDLTDVRMIRLRKFQRAIRRLRILARAMNRKGKTEFRLGGLIFELAGEHQDDEFEELEGTPAQIKDFKWVRAIISQFKFEDFVNQETVEDLEDKLQHIRTTVATQNDLFTILKRSINEINF